MIDIDKIETKRKKDILEDMAIEDFFSELLQAKIIRNYRTYFFMWLVWRSLLLKLRGTSRASGLQASTWRGKAACLRILRIAFNFQGDTSSCTARAFCVHLWITRSRKDFAC